MPHSVSQTAGVRNRALEYGLNAAMAQRFLVFEVVVQRAFRHPCSFQDGVQIGALITTFIDFHKASIQQATSSSLRIAAGTG